MPPIMHMTVPVVSLSLHHREEMFRLMESYYLGVTREQFEIDLAEKEHVILLKEGAKSESIVGFSTLMCLDLQIGGKSVKVVFSGDTIVSRQSRGTFGLGLEIVRYFAQTGEKYPNTELFYVLIAKGWQTCRIPAFLFREFSPSSQHSVLPRHQQVMDAFGAKKYPRSYQPEKGLIIYSGEAQRVKPGSLEGEIPPRDDPQIEIFVKKNPNYLQGDELVYVAPIATENFTRVTLRMLAAGREAQLVR